MFAGLLAGRLSVFFATNDTATYPRAHAHLSFHSYQSLHELTLPTKEETEARANGGASLGTYDGDNASGGGFMVTAVVNFDELGTKETATLVAKSDAGGFALEQVQLLLRFGVHVGDKYHYASTSMLGFNDTDSYFIVGAYDGRGAVRLWVNNVERDYSGDIKGGVTLNNSPIVIGADPEGATGRRYFFTGKIQQVMVQKWRGH